MVSLSGVVFEVSSLFESDLIIISDVGCCDIGDSDARFRFLDLGDLEEVDWKIFGSAIR